MCKKVSVSDDASAQNLGAVRPGMFRFYSSILRAKKHIFILLFYKTYYITEIPVRKITLCRQYFLDPNFLFLTETVVFIKQIFSLTWISFVPPCGVETPLLPLSAVTCPFQSHA